MSKSKLEILAYEDTPLGVLCLRRRELLSQAGTFVTEVTLNHEFLMSSLYTDSEQTLATMALQDQSGDQLRVLVGGFGLGYTAHQALACERVAHVEVVELLPPVIDWLHQGLVPLSDELMDESRLVVTQGDIYQRLASPSQARFNAILIDVDHSPDEHLGESNAAFYSPSGLMSAKRHLAKDGILAVWSYAQSSPFADALEEVFHHVRVESVVYDNQLIDERRTDWLFFAHD